MAKQTKSKTTAKIVEVKSKNSFTAFFKELWQRLAAPSPAFFKVIRRFLESIIALGALALSLEGLNVELPDFIKEINKWTIISAAIAGWIIAKLPNINIEDKVQEGELPFTAKKMAEGKK